MSTVEADPNRSRRTSVRLALALAVTFAAMLAWAEWRPAQRGVKQAPVAADDEPQPQSAPGPVSSKPPMRPIGRAVPPPQVVPLANGPIPPRKLGMFGALRAGRQFLPEQLRAQRPEPAPESADETKPASNPAVPAPKSWAALDAHWQRESFDPKWTGEMKSYLDATARAANIDVSAIQGIDCRATACRVRFGFTSPQAALQFQSAGTALRGYEAHIVPSDARPGAENAAAPRIEMMVDRDVMNSARSSPAATVP